MTADSADDQTAQLVGTTLDKRYRLDALVGEGGMGAVYRAQHLAMDRRVAVKLLKPHLTTDKTQLERFAREARSTLRVDSPHAVKVLDFGVTPHRDYYMALEYLDGRTVQRELDIDGPFAPARAIHIARQALHALGAAHREGLVHRDVKPDNILLMRQGDDPDFAKVLDFGVAKLMEGAARSTRSQLAITQAGMVFGTPAFVSPEQACGLPLDARSDLYSLAATLFVMVTGCPLFEATSPIAWLTHHARTPAPHLADLQPSLAVHRELDELLQRCLSKQRDERPSDAEELDRLLAAIPISESAPAPRAPEPSDTAIAAKRTPTTAALKAVLLSTSGYFDALAPTPAQAMAPVRAKTAEEPGGRPADDASDSSARRTSARGRWILAIAIPAAAIVAVAIGLAVARSPRRDAAAPPPPAATSKVADATPAPAPPASAPTTPAPPAPAPSSPPGSSPASVVEAPRAPAKSPAPERPASPRGAAPAAAPRARVEALLTEASAAQRDGNRLRYLSLADEAHRADPRHVRARLMYADALILTDNADKGCLQLRALKHLAEARARASSAGCPAD